MNADGRNENVATNTKKFEWLNIFEAMFKVCEMSVVEGNIHFVFRNEQSQMKLRFLAESKILHAFLRTPGISLHRIQNDATFIETWIQMKQDVSWIYHKKKLFNNKPTSNIFDNVSMIYRVILMYFNRRVRF